MKPILIILLFVFQASALETVPGIELEKYMGKWNEIASIPQRFQRDCYRNTTAEYSLEEDNEVKVINSCERDDETRKSSEGRARVNPDFEDTAKLEVTFLKFLGKWVWSFAGDYWIIKLGHNYSWSVVGHPDLDYLWILAREESLSNRTLKNIRNHLENVGYDTCEVLMSRTSETSFEERPRLCDLDL